MLALCIEETQIEIRLVSGVLERIEQGERRYFGSVRSGNSNQQFHIIPQVTQSFKYQLNCLQTAVGMLLKEIVQEEQKINGFAIKQIMKKPLMAVTKELSEQPI
ncbi:MAG: hypothetical protein EZS28_020848 [Streblomastix strix]|uniref:Uncharacterized protein n=1 Tax=Streblomastix strix TaxID=222440 RepID=A0A5J4VMF6_9EUKA|nr:MAG: hypothetical protein EZS28_020848 [Streblomastix strix]